MTNIRKDNLNLRDSGGDTPEKTDFSSPASAILRFGFEHSDGESTTKGTAIITINNLSVASDDPIGFLVFEENGNAIATFQLIKGGAI